MGKKADDANEIKILGERMTTLQFREDFVTVGRSSSNHIALHYKSISRKHCVIVRDSSKRFRVIDLASLGGTFVNGKKIKSAFIGPEDVVKVGNVVLFFHLDQGKLTTFFNEKGELAVPGPENSTEEAPTDTNLTALDEDGKPKKTSRDL